MKAFMNLISGVLPPELARFEYLIPRLEELLNVALIVAVSFGAVFAVYLGVRLAIAEDQNQRAAAKKHIITFVASMVLVVFLIYIIRALTSYAQTL